MWESGFCAVTKTRVRKLNTNIWLWLCTTAATQTRQKPKLLKLKLRYVVVAATCCSLVQLLATFLNLHFGIGIFPSANDFSEIFHIQTLRGKNRKQNCGRPNHISIGVDLCVCVCVKNYKSEIFMLLLLLYLHCLHLAQ